VGGAVLSVQPSGSIVSPGTVLNLSINISGVADLYHYQFDLSFNPAAFQMQSETEAGFLATGGATFFLPGFLDNVNGTVTFTGDFYLSAIPGVSGSGCLADFSFLATVTGSSAFSLSNVILQDSAGGDIPFTTEDAWASATPEPSSVWLLAAGLFAAGALKFRSRACLPSPSTW
jgi:hypothetical protein